VGNIDLGNDLPLTALKPHYDAILFAYGASKDKELGIPGEKALRSVYSARAFVGWYNGLPEHRDLEPDLTSGEDAVIVGQGNVALDVARILLSDVDALRGTDIADYSLEALSKSRIKRVRVVGRRGPLQVSANVGHWSRTSMLIWEMFRPHLRSKRFVNYCNCPPLPLNRSTKTSFLLTRS
jgi:adrenodoxin-NADP+ reductase